MRLFEYFGFQMPSASRTLSAFALGGIGVVLQSLRTGIVTGAVLSPAARATERLRRGIDALRESFLAVAALSALATLPGIALVTLTRLYVIRFSGPVGPAFTILAVAQAVWGIAYPMLFFTATTVAVGERLGPLAALARAFRLGQGWRWRLAGLIAIYFLASGLLGLLIRYGPTPPPGPGMHSPASAIMLLIGFTAIVVTNLVLVFSAAAYRVLTAGAQPELASVFD